jgi:hypothetical protein
LNCRLTIREQRLLIGLVRLLAQFNGRAEPDAKDRKLAERLLSSRGRPVG